MKLALLAALLIASPAAVRATVTPGDFPGALPVLVGLDHVRADLGLTSTQKRQLDGIRSDFRKSAREIVRTTGESPGDRTAADAKLQNLKDTANARVLKVLTPAQATRLKEIQHQTLGSTMLVSPSVQKSLDLTSWQVSAIEKIRRKGVEYVGRVNQWFHNGEISQAERLDLLRDRRIRQARAMELLLSPSQRRALAAMHGKPLQPS